MTQFVQYDLGHIKRGAKVVVRLGAQANVLLLDSSNFNSYRNGQQHRYYGGRMTRSPATILVPHDAYWYVAIDLGGYSGTIESSVTVEPPPRGYLPEYREPNLVQSVRHTRVDDPLAPGLDAADVKDVFISHASEDKDAVARPLANALARLGVSAWLDEAELRIGDSLRRKIDHGIATSRFAVVVMSPNFFAKNWTNYELDGIVTRSVTGEQNLLPIWHNITQGEVAASSPSLADKVALTTASLSVEEIAKQIAEVIGATSD